MYANCQVVATVCLSTSTVTMHRLCVTLKRRCVMHKYANCHSVTVCSETGPPTAGRIAPSHCGHRTGRLGSGMGPTWQNVICCLKETWVSHQLCAALTVPPSLFNSSAHVSDRQVNVGKPSVGHCFSWGPTALTCTRQSLDSYPHDTSWSKWLNERAPSGRAWTRVSVVWRKMVRCPTLEARRPNDNQATTQVSLRAQAEKTEGTWKIPITC